MSNEYKPTYVDNTDNSISTMESTDTISFCKTGTKINTLSAKNVAHKKTGEDLNLCAFNNSNFNPVITINNNHNDCRIMTNLNVNGNLNINNNLIIPTHSETSNLLANIQGSIYYNTSENMYEGYSQTEGWQPLGGFSKTKDAIIHKNLNVIGNINLTNEGMIKTTGQGSFGSITTTGSITTNNQDINAGSGTVSANTFNGQIAWSNITGTKNTSDLNNNSGYITSLSGLTASYSDYFKVKWKSDNTMYNLLFTNAGSSQSTWQEGYQDSGHWLQWNPSTNLLTSIESLHIQSVFKIKDHTIERFDANTIRYEGEAGKSELSIRTDTTLADASLYARVSMGTYWAGAYIQFQHASFSSSMAISGSSDDRIKTDEELIVNVTPILLKLRPQKYKKYTGDTIEKVKKKIEENSTEYIIESGLIAQEMFYEVPELRFLVGNTIDENLVDNIPRDFADIKNDPDYSAWSNEISNVNYTGLIPYLIRGFQEQQTEINTLKTENEQQQTKINELTSIIDKLKTANSFEDFKNSL